MQNDRNHLTMHSEEIKGNNPYLLNRMTIDSSFKTPQCDINTMVGYGADGKIISNSDHYNPFASRISNTGFDDVKKASTSLVSANAQRTHWSFINEPKPGQNRNLESDLDEIKTLIPNAQKKHKKKSKEKVTTVPDWRIAFKPSSVIDGQDGLQKLTEERYKAILRGTNS